jgi:hypothetical protein
MKILKNKGFRVALLTLSLMLAITFSANADVPPPPGGSGGSGPGGSDLPVGAPLDGGLTLLLILGASYGAKKHFSLKK